MGGLANGWQTGTPSCWPATMDDRQWLDAGQRQKSRYRQNASKRRQRDFFGSPVSLYLPAIKNAAAGVFVRSGRIRQHCRSLRARTRGQNHPAGGLQRWMDGQRQNLLAVRSGIACWQVANACHASRPSGITLLVACNGCLPAVAQVGEQSVGDCLLADGCRLMAAHERAGSQKKKKREGGGGACAHADDLGGWRDFRQNAQFSPSPPAPP